jgi:hypothetical protein
MGSVEPYATELAGFDRCGGGRRVERKRCQRRMEREQMLADARREAFYESSRNCQSTSSS